MRFPLCLRATLEDVQRRLACKHESLQDLGRENVALRQERTKYRQLVLAQQKRIEELDRAVAYYKHLLVPKRAS